MFFIYLFIYFLSVFHYYYVVCDTNRNDKSRDYSLYGLRNIVARVGGGGGGGDGGCFKSIFFNWAAYACYRPGRLRFRRYCGSKTLLFIRNTALVFLIPKNSGYQQQMWPSTDRRMGKKNYPRPSRVHVKSFAVYITAEVGTRAFHLQLVNRGHSKYNIYCAYLDYRLRYVYIHGAVDNFSRAGGRMFSRIIKLTGEVKAFSNR